MATPPWFLTGLHIAFWGLLGLFALSEFAMQFRSHRNPSGTRTERWSLTLVDACIVIALIAGFGLTRWSQAGFKAGALPLFVVGLLFVATGIFVRQWSMITLGRFFTADVRMHSDQTVVDRGPYRWVRHPSYAGIIIFNLGVGLALGNWAALAVLLVLPTLGLVVRIRSEERALVAQLGDDYRDFAGTRRRLLPGVW